jgi:signal transduction histidine kinase
MIIADETEQVELRRALERIQRMEDLGLLAGGLAHDFNNMLSVLAQNVALARSDDGIPESTRAHLQNMAMAIEKGSVLATRLVQYSRAHEIQTRIVQIDDIVNVALELTRPLLRNRIRVKTELAPGLPAVEADPARLEQVLVNLILNALDAMPDEGELTVRTELLTGDVVSDGVSDETKKFLVVNIVDTGVGIPQSLHTTIFDPFFTTKPEGKGTGLGLASAAAIVRQHKGHIKVESAPGAGTKFSIYLPVAAKGVHEKST